MFIRLLASKPNADCEQIVASPQSGLGRHLRRTVGARIRRFEYGKINPMNERVISSLDQVTTDWLTAVLARSGALTVGIVVRFDVEAGRGNWSTSGRLHLHYSQDAQGDLPESLFLKLVNTNTGDGEFFGPSEVAYYTRDYLGVKDAPLLRCYDGRFSAALQRYHLLLEDVSQTHIEAVDKTPTLAYGLALAEGLAVLHAHWWGAQRLAEANALIHEPGHIRRFVAIAEPGAGHIIRQLAVELEPHWPDAIRELFDRHPQAMIARERNANGFTLIHGDVGQTNVLLPRVGERPLYIIDRQPFDWSLTTWLGVYDLAYAIVLDWEVEKRRRLEMPVLHHYHEWLIKRGVQGYSWEQLFDDYRLCVAMGVYVAVEYCRGGINRDQDIWLPMLQRALTACDDLDCANLWR